MVKICCIGAGYVGGPAMAVMALKCPSIEVTVVDVSRPRIDAWNSDRLPVLEPGLDAVVRTCRGRNLLFSADVDRHVAAADIVFVSVDTPTKARGAGAGRAPDLAYWESAARVVAASATASAGKSKIVVEKSAVPVRAAEAMERILHAHAGGGAAFRVLSNPEFFSEGSAVRDLLRPDRVLVGGRDADAMRALRELYLHWVPSDRIISTGLCSAELAKLAANALLAQRVSSANAISALCEATGADASDVTRAVAADGRVGGSHLTAGESPAADVCRALVGDRALVSVYDPAVSERQIRREMAAAPPPAKEKVRVSVARDAYEAAEGAHGVCVLTGWEEFRTLDYRRIFDGMRRPAFVFDGRGVVDVGKLREIGFVVYAVGKPLDPWLKGLPAVA